MFSFAFNSFEEAIYMNGHGIYVWSVYLIGILMIATSFLIANKRIKAIQKKIKISNASS